MQKEKIAAIGLAIIIIGALSIYFSFEYGEEILENLFGKETKVKTNVTIALGDCADVHYIGRTVYNNIIFDSSYNDTLNKTGGTPMQMFISLNESAISPKAGYTGIIKGLAEGLVGLKEGDTTTIGPIPPEKAYGIPPLVGDTIEISDPTGELLLERNLSLIITEINENVSLPEEFIGYGFEDPTTIYLIKDQSYYLGETMTFYQPWENATVVTKINETMIWIETNPPEDKIYNFTWKEIDINTGSEIEYWENASSVTTMNDTTIVITHSPAINETLELISGYTPIEYTVVNLTDDKINVSYIETDGNTSYTELDRKVIIPRNQSQEIVFSFPKEFFEQILTYVFKPLDPTIPYSLDKLAGETLLFEVEIIKVYKSDQN